MNVELFLENYKLDLKDDYPILLNYQFDDIFDPGKIKNDYSKTIVLPNTPNNNKVFGHIWNINKEVIVSSSFNTGIYFNPSKKTNFKLIYNGAVYKTGYVKMNDIVFDENGNWTYNITLYGVIGNFFNALGDDTIFDSLSGSSIYNQNIYLTKEAIASLYLSQKPNYKSRFNSNSLVNFYQDYTLDPYLINQTYYNDKIFDIIDSENGIYNNSTKVEYSDGYNTDNALDQSDLGNELTETYMRNKLTYKQRFGLYTDVLLKNVTLPYGYTIDWSDFENRYNPYWFNTLMTCNLLEDVNTNNSITVTESNSLEQIYNNTTPVYRNSSNYVTVYNDSLLYASGGRVYFTDPNITTKNFNLSIKTVSVLKITGLGSATYTYTWQQTLDDNCFVVRLGLTTVTGFDQYKFVFTTNAVADSNNNKKLSSTWFTNKGLTTDYITLKWKAYQPSNSSEAVVEVYDYLTSTWMTFHDYTNQYYTTKSLTITQSSIESEMYISKKWATAPTHIAIHTTNSKAALTSVQYGVKVDLEGVYNVTQLNRLSDKSRININRLLPKIKIKDFLLSYIKMFGLYLTVDEDTKIVKIQTRNNYYEGYKILDWDNKLCLDKPLNIIPLNFDKKKIRFGYNKKKDSQLQKKYLDNNKLYYGDQIINTGYDYNNDEFDYLSGNIFEPIISKDLTTTITGTEDSTSYKVIPVNAKENSNKLENYNPFGLVFMNGNISTPPNYNNTDLDNIHFTIVGDTPNMLNNNEFIHNKSYAKSIYVNDKFKFKYVKPFSESESLLINKYSILTDNFYYKESGDGYPSMKNITHSLNFGKPTEVYFSTSDINFPNESTIYNRYFKTWIEDRYNLNTKIMNASFYLSPLDIFNFNFKNFIYLQNSYWSVNKIIDFDITKDQPTEVELIKVNDINNYTIGQKAFDNTLFSIKVNTTVSNTTVTLPTVNGYNYNATIEWGDGTTTSLTTYNGSGRSHVYTSAGDHIITILGEFGAFNTQTSDNTTIRSYLTQVYSCGNVNTINVSFYNCTRLTTLSTNIFKYNVNITSFNSTFSGCVNLTTLPTDLFRYNVNATDFYRCFYFCTSLTTLPTDLFRYNILGNNFVQCFYNCISLISIPGDLFKYNVNNTSFEDTFSYCSSLTTLPSNLFRYNTLVTTFLNCFSFCTSLTSIPTDFFRYNINVTNFNSCFANCSNLVSFPYTLFDYNTNALSFAYCFYDCNSLTGNAPELWLRTPAPNGSQCFYDCLGLTNYSSIPLEWRNVISFKFKINVTKPNTLVTLPTVNGYNYNCVISWGDDVWDELTTWNGVGRSHTYVNPGDYVIYILNEFGAFNTRESDNKTIRNYVTEIYSCGDNTTISINFGDCNRLKTIYNNAFRYNTNVTNFSNCFSFCTSLISIPTDLFRYNTLVTDFNNCFSFCTSLTSIPTDLFRYNINVISYGFGSCFGFCSSLTSIPTDLFRYNVNATDFSGCFNGCSSLTTLPVDLFKYNTLVTSLSYCFGFCSSLTSIPTDLFRYNINVISYGFYNCFNSCSSLTTLPVDLFRYNVNATDFSGCFNGCSSLTSIPVDLFRYNTLVTSFSGCFKGCSSLTSIPVDLFRYNTLVTSFSGCFKGCSSLTTLPVDLFKYNTLVTSFISSYDGGCFQGCSSLTTLPVDLFRYNVNATDFCINTLEYGRYYNKGCFQGCSSLTSIPVDLFRYNTLVTSLSYCFDGCSSLTSIPSTLITYNVNVTDFSGCFRDCTSLTSIPSVLFDNINDVFNFNECFSNCVNLTGASPEIWNAFPGCDGSLCFYNCENLDNYDEIQLEWKLQIFKITVNTTVSNTTITLPTVNGYSYNATIDWGDGTTTTLTTYNGSGRSHVYVSTGDHVIKIIGFFGAFNTQTSDNTTIRSYLTNVYSCGNVSTYNISFYDCTSLDLNYFYLNDEFQISNTFKYNTNITTFYNCFYNCRFSEIPTDLFKYNTLVNNFDNCFSDNPQLYNIPVDLFRYNTLVPSFNGTFANCTNLHYIDNDIFKYNTLVTSFSSCFYNCTDLQSIPSEIFTYNTLVTDFDSCFSGCGSINSYAPTLWLSFPTADGTECFNNCLNILNYTSIPANWK